MNRLTVGERLLRKLMAADNGCLEWVGYTNRSGYGAITVGSRTDGTRRQVETHRVAWILANGPILDDLCVLHHCDNPPCCDVTHLFLGTKADNNVDMASKGRNHEQKKTHCPAGHPFSEINTHVNVKGWRRCRQCNAAAQRRYYRAHKQAIS